MTNSDDYPNPGWQTPPLEEQEDVFLLQLQQQFENETLQNELASFPQERLQQDGFSFQPPAEGGAGFQLQAPPQPGNTAGIESPPLQQQAAFSDEAPVAQADLQAQQNSGTGFQLQPPPQPGNTAGIQLQQAAFSEEAPAAQADLQARQNSGTGFQLQPPPQPGNSAGIQLQQAAFSEEASAAQADLQAQQNNSMGFSLQLPPQMAQEALPPQPTAEPANWETPLPTPQAFLQQQPQQEQESEGFSLHIPEGIPAVLPPLYIAPEPEPEPLEIQLLEETLPEQGELPEQPLQYAADEFPFENLFRKYVKVRPLVGKVEFAAGCVLVGVSFLLAVLIAFMMVVSSNLESMVAGIGAYTVNTTDMEKTLWQGEVVLVRRVSAEKVQKEDVLVYTSSTSPGRYVMHRVVGVTQNKEDSGAYVFETKADANPLKDEYVVTEDSIIGKVAFTIPYGEKITALFQNNMAIVVLLLVLVLTLIALLLISLITAKKNR